MLIDSLRNDESFAQFYADVRPHLEGKQVIAALNKCDTDAGAATPLLPPAVTSDITDCTHAIPISAKYGLNIGHLRTLLVSLTGLDTLSATDVIVTNIRHYEALTHAVDAISRVIDGLCTGLPSDLVAQDLRECLYHLADILGEVTTTEVLNSIFASFCIGK